MAVLLHTCCGPCLAGSYPILEQNLGINNTVLFWENPNIHPFVEYNQRLNSFIKMAEALRLKILPGDADYGLDRFIQVLGGDFGPDRCATCYRLRLTATAKAAAKNAFTAFSTTLLISPYQNHDLLIATGKEVGEQNGVSFYYADFRPGFSNTHEAARQHELYRQKYCGCIFSEHDRFRNDKKFLNPLLATDVKSSVSTKREV